MSPRRVVDTIIERLGLEPPPGAKRDMAPSADFLEFLKDQLRGLGHITTRRMFSGAGLYCDGVIFALILRDTLYFKVDDGNRQAYEAEGLEPFTYEARGRTGAGRRLLAGARAAVRRARRDARLGAGSAGGGTARRGEEEAQAESEPPLAEAELVSVNDSQPGAALECVNPACRHPASSRASSVVSSRRSKSDSGTPFHVVLDRLINQGDAPGGATSHWRPVRRRAIGRSLADVAAPAACDTAAAQMYIDADLSEAAPQGTPRSVEEAVALELQLSDDLEPAELERMRRTFAYRNHPDRVGPAHQARALLRMTVANVLIDQALKAARTRTR